MGGWFDSIDWDPSHSEIFRRGVAFNEVAALGATYLLSPSLTAHLSQEFATVNANNGIANLPGIESLDPRLSPVAIEGVVPTMEFVAEAAAVYGGDLLVPYYGGLVTGAAGGIALKYLENQSGIPQGTGDYAKWAIYVGAASGEALGIHQNIKDAQTTAAANNPTPSASTDPGYNPGTGANQNPGGTPADLTSLQKLQAAVSTYKPYFDVAGQIYGAAKPFLAAGSSTTKTGSGTGTAGASGAQPVNMAGFGLAAILFVVAMRKFQN